MSEQEEPISHSLRGLASIIANQGYHDSWVKLVRKAADLLETQPHPSGIPVQIAVATGMTGKLRYVNVCGIDDYGDQHYAVLEVAGDTDDGRAIVEAIIPANLVPVVKGLTRA
jgi:hypothetical protein